MQEGGRSLRVRMIPRHMDTKNAPWTKTKKNKKNNLMWGGGCRLGRRIVRLCPLGIRHPADSPDLPDGWISPIGIRNRKASESKSHKAFTTEAGLDGVGGVAEPGGRRHGNATGRPGQEAAKDSEADHAEHGGDWGLGAAALGPGQLGIRDEPAMEAGIKGQRVRRRQ